MATFNQNGFNISHNAQDAFDSARIKRWKAKGVNTFRTYDWGNNFGRTGALLTRMVQEDCLIVLHPVWHEAEPHEREAAFKWAGNHAAEFPDNIIVSTQAEMNTSTATWNQRHRQQTQWILDGAQGRPIRFALESNNENHDGGYRYESFKILEKADILRADNIKEYYCCGYFYRERPVNRPAEGANPWTENSVEYQTWEYPRPGEWDLAWLDERVADLQASAKALGAQPFVCEFGVWDDEGNKFRADQAQRDLYIRDVYASFNFHGIPIMYWNTDDGFKLPDVEKNEITDKYTGLMRLEQNIKTLYSGDEGPFDPPDNGPVLDPDDTAAIQMQLDRIEAAIAALPAAIRQIVREEIDKTIWEVAGLSEFGGQAKKLKP